MANRRMFSKSVARTDAFLDMSQSAQNLYFHLGIDADDDGFVSPKMVMRLLGSTSDDLNMLKLKRFIIPFQSGVIVIRHWRENNYIQADRYKPSIYTERDMLLVSPKGIYEYEESYDPTGKDKEEDFKHLPRVYTGRIQDVRLGEVRLGKDRLNLVALGSATDIIEVKDEYKPTRTKVDTSYRTVFTLWGASYPINWRANRTEIAAAKNILFEHTLEGARNALDFYREHLHEEKCPQILKPSDLDRKWVNLQTFRDRR